MARISEMPRTPAPQEKRALTHEQAAALLEAVKGDALEAFVVVGLTTGLRPGELLGLRWDGIDLEARTLDVTGSLKREGSTLRLGDVKRGIRRSRRRIDLHERAVVALRAHGPSSASNDYCRQDWQDYALVFASEVGTPITPSNMNRKLGPVTAGASMGIGA